MVCHRNRSRSGRLALTIAVMACLVRRVTRRWTLAMLPSLATAFWIGFYFQSLPLALQVFADRLMEDSGSVTIVDSATLGLKGRFFHDKHRWGLLVESVEWFRSAPVLKQVVGDGLGVAGYVTSRFPEPHMSPLDVLIETGILGASILGAFIVALWTKLRRMMVGNNFVDESERAFAILLAVVTASMACLTYEVQTWGYVMVLYMMAVGALCLSDRKAHSPNFRATERSVDFRSQP